MQCFPIARACALAAALVLPFAGPSLAKEPALWSKATLVTPASEPLTAAADGVDWTCEAADCKGVVTRRAPDFPLMRECKGVVAVLGPLAAFETHGREMSTSQLAVCNKSAKTE